MMARDAAVFCRCAVPLLVTTRIPCPSLCRRPAYSLPRIEMFFHHQPENGEEYIGSLKKMVKNIRFVR